MRTDKQRDSNFKLDDVPLESSLGFLAIGDIAFEKWREVKKKYNMDNKLDE